MFGRGIGAGRFLLEEQKPRGNLTSSRGNLIRERGGGEVEGKKMQGPRVPQAARRQRSQPKQHEREGGASCLEEGPGGGASFFRARACHRLQEGGAANRNNMKQSKGEPKGNPARGRSREGGNEKWGERKRKEEKRGREEGKGEKKKEREKRKRKGKKEKGEVMGGR